jgi:hypothetical protein
LLRQIKEDFNKKKHTVLDTETLMMGIQNDKNSLGKKWHFLKKLNILARQVRILALDIYSSEMKTFISEKTCIKMCITTILTMFPNNPKVR